ncbi:peptidase m64 [Trichoderma arundinaceum]|uniref:Peptidase m64 n=1 Tax=Trichoderma arundinaceum TaxID=490622 RepID=A0A395NTY4_TRIAR|nr:peptidase m64 [Trichoderma arundinaceum]
MEGFYSSDNNTIHSRYWTSGGGWMNSGQDKYLRSAAGTGITGVSCEESHIEIFYVGTNGNLAHSCLLDSGANWVVDSVLAGSDWGTLANKGIGALSRNSQHQEVWWITTTGTINLASWDSLNDWGYSSMRPDGTAHPSSGIAILARSNVRENVFYIGSDQKVYQRFWIDGMPIVWKFEKLSDLHAAPGSSAAVSMNSQHMEVFWTALDGSVTHVYW